MQHKELYEMCLKGIIKKDSTLLRVFYSDFDQNSLTANPIH